MQRSPGPRRMNVAPPATSSTPPNENEDLSRAGSFFSSVRPFGRDQETKDVEKRYREKDLGSYSLSKGASEKSKHVIQRAEKALSAEARVIDVNTLEDLIRQRVSEFYTKPHRGTIADTAFNMLESYPIARLAEKIDGKIQAHLEYLSGSDKLPSKKIIDELISNEIANAVAVIHDNIAAAHHLNNASRTLGLSSYQKQVLAGAVIEDVLYKRGIRMEDKSPKMRTGQFRASSISLMRVFKKQLADLNPQAQAELMSVLFSPDRNLEKLLKLEQSGKGTPSEAETVSLVDVLRGQFDAAYAQLEKDDQALLRIAQNLFSFVKQDFDPVVMRYIIKANPAIARKILECDSSSSDAIENLAGIFKSEEEKIQRVLAEELEIIQSNRGEAFHSREIDLPIRPSTFFNTRLLTEESIRLVNLETMQMEDFQVSRSGSGWVAGPAMLRLVSDDAGQWMDLSTLSEKANKSKNDIYRCEVELRDRRSGTFISIPEGSHSSAATITEFMQECLQDRVSEEELSKTIDRAFTIITQQALFNLLILNGEDLRKAFIEEPGFYVGLPLGGKNSRPLKFTMTFSETGDLYIGSLLVMNEAKNLYVVDNSERPKQLFAGTEDFDASPPRVDISEDAVVGGCIAGLAKLDIPDPHSGQSGDSSSKTLTTFLDIAGIYWPV